MSNHTTQPILKPVPGFAGLYASADGHVWSALQGNNIRRLRGAAEPGGYRRVSVKCGDGKFRPEYVHRLVLLTFAGPCPAGCQFRHLDGDPTNNAAANLRWATPKRNAQDRRKHGTAGVRYPDAVKRAAVALSAAGWSQAALTELFGAGDETVRRWLRSAAPTTPATAPPPVSER